MPIRCVDADREHRDWSRSRFGAILLWAFTAWQRHRENAGRDPLVHLALMKIATVRSGLVGLFTQHLILMGILFIGPSICSGSLGWTRCCGGTALRALD